MSLRFKRHYPLLLLLIGVLAFLTLALGNQRIIAYTTQTSRQGVRKSAINYTNAVALFDSTLVHRIQILMSDDDYEQMITTYRQTGVKNYFHADVIIDGVRVNDVGIRLKGNASLRTALGRGGGGMPGGGQPPAGGNQPPADGGRAPFGPRNAPPGLPGGGARQELPQGAAPAGWGQTSGTTKLPFMIKFDKFVSGQTYQGYSALAIRTYGTSSDAAMLQEPVTNDVFHLIGLPATQTAYVGVRLGDEAEQLYTISEIIDETYLARHFSNANGVLYKAELGSSLSYQGEDPSSYAKSFTQQTRVNDADMAPLITFIRFLSQSDDATFESELPDYLDVDAFAAYLAVNNLLVNTDSIAGMNNNYYLYYDDVAQRFTLLMWDANESLGKLGGGNRGATFDLYYQNQQTMRGPGGGQNTLVKRFLANSTFKALYERKLRQIYQQAFVSGAITRQVEQYAALIHRANAGRNLVVLENYDQAAAQVKTFLSQRTEFLKTTSLLGQ